MQGPETILGLVEQAACDINVLDPANPNELNELLSTVSQINEQISHMAEGPSDLVEQAKDSSATVVSLLDEMIAGNAASLDKAAETISQQVSVLQDAVAGLTDTPEAEAPSPAMSEEDDAILETIIPEDDVPLVIDFVAEACEHIEAAEGGLLDLETNPEDQEVLNLIFRAFHTIKGMAGFLNLTDIGSLAHSAENLLDLARKGELLLTGHYTDLVFQSIDLIKTMIADLQRAIQDSSPVTVPDELGNLLDQLHEATEKSPEKDKAPAGSEGSTQGTTPQPEIVELVPPATKETVGEAVTSPSESAEATVESVQQASPVEAQTPGQPAKQVERRSGTDRMAGGGDRRASVVDEKIKVSTKRLDNLVNMAGELVIAQLMVAEEVTNKLAQHYGLNQKVVHQGKIVRELQELSMSMRMVPIAGVFQKMARLVRDLSHKAGKEIQFVTRGEDTELDRNIVDKIADPLVHMIRNSIDHGVEPPEDRKAAGKPESGHIELRAFHQSGHIVIEIEDDGRGLDKKRILEKAIDNGVVDPNQELSDEEIYKLIFHAGLSTAKKITDVSGRGVGMDVVKKNIESLRGKIEISSVLGKGTTFTIRMPLTLAIIDGQVVRIGTNRYIVPINSIVRTLSPKQDQLSSVQNRGEMVMVRGNLLPLVRLYKLFGVDPSSEDPTKALLVIVEEDGRQCSLLVDELLSQQQVVIKSLGEGLGGVLGVSGGAIMGDGKVSLILDIPGLMELAQNNPV